VKMFDAKTRIMGYRGVKKNYVNMLSRFHPIPERHGQTNGQTDRFAISISRVSVLTDGVSLTRDKNTDDEIVSST